MEKKMADHSGSSLILGELARETEELGFSKHRIKWVPHNLEEDQYQFWDNLLKYRHNIRLIIHTSAVDKSPVKKT